MVTVEDGYEKFIFDFGKNGYRKALRFHPDG
jgi:hypothetical protein